MHLYSFYTQFEGGGRNFILPPPSNCVYGVKIEYHELKK